MNPTKMILTFLFAGGLLLGGTGCPAKAPDKASPDAQAPQKAPASEATEAKDGSAASAGDVPDVSQHHDNAPTPLMQAALKGDAGAVKKLIEQGADVNAHDSNGKTALDVAKTDEVKELLTKAGGKFTCQGVHFPRKFFKHARSEMPDARLDAGSFVQDASGPLGRSDGR